MGVYAGANDKGSLFNTMGLQCVIAHYEGNRVIINAPTMRTFADADGRPVTYFGWWIKLAHNGTHGLTNLYFEAIARDTTMQNRVIGPFLFLPSATLYDYDVEVAASQDEVAGVRYKTVANAMAYFKTKLAQRPRIRMTEAFSGDLESPSSPYVAEGYCTIEATAPVLIHKTYADRAELRLKYDRVRFRGGNITFDMRHIARLRPYNTGNFQFDGVHFIQSGGRDELWNKGDRPAAHLVSYVESKESPWFTECTFSNTANSVMQRAYARGCAFNTVAPDLADACLLLLGCTINDLDNTVSRTEIDALQVHYTGVGASATLALSGTLGSNSRTFTAKVDGSVVGTFVVGGTSADFAADTNYNVADVAAWINALESWTATLLDDTRKAVQLGLPDTNGNNFIDTDVKTRPTMLVTQFDFHPDIMQRTSVDENVIVADNVGYNLVAQSIFLNLYQLCDMLIVNNAFADKAGVTTYFSQLASNHRHVVIAHNSLATQGILLRPDLGYSVDGYCLIANNVFASMEWCGTPITTIAMHNNHLHEKAPIPPYATGTTVGGDGHTLFVDALNGDFRPAGALLTDTKKPIIAYDGQQRSRLSVASTVGAML
ncbi:hypothetical protein B2G71_19200 [Novosphingobium sp. PC22D]|nr:hypothetical protein B2G71_19200 [Novosphingobium sp. PC22D]